MNVNISWNMSFLFIQRTLWSFNGLSSIIAILKLKKPGETFLLEGNFYISKRINTRSKDEYETRGHSYFIFCFPSNSFHVLSNSPSSYSFGVIRISSTLYLASFICWSLQINGSNIHDVRDYSSLWVAFKAHILRSVCRKIRPKLYYEFP